MAGTTSFPMNFANIRGIPMIASTSVEVTTDNVVIGIPKRAFRFLNGNGVILFRLNTALPEAAGTLPILFASNEFTQALTLVGGDAATPAQMGDTGVYLIYYDKSCNLLQLMTLAVEAAATQNTSTTSTEETNNSMRTVKK